MIDAHVLVLNRFYQPVNITNARQALCMMFLGRARAIDGAYQLFGFLDWAAQPVENQHESVGLTHKRRIRVPRVLVLQRYEAMPIGRVRFSRHNVFLRDRYTCQYCLRQLLRRQLNIDHVTPRSQAGRTSWENVVTCCIPCNLRKGGRTPEQAGMRLNKRPIKPRWSTVLHPDRVAVRYAEWLPFLGRHGQATTQETSGVQTDATSQTQSSNAEPQECAVGQS